MDDIEFKMAVVERLSKIETILIPLHKLEIRVRKVERFKAWTMGVGAATIAIAGTIISILKGI